MNSSCKIYIEIPGLPKMANGGHGHWKANHYEKKGWKDQICHLLAFKRPLKPYGRIKCTFTRHSSSEPDFDGLVHGFKAIRDALVLSGIVINDKTANIEATYLWQKAPQNKGKISIEITPIE